jgi:hypothetical protein
MLFHRNSLDRNSLEAEFSSNPTFSGSNINFSGSNGAFPGMP